MDEHRVPMLGGAWRRRSDPSHSADPKVREIIGALAGLPVAPEPRPEFTAELRAQLVAVTPRLVAEGEPTPAARPREATTAPRRDAQRTGAQPTARRRPRILKPLIAVACVLGAFVLLLGGAVLLSRHALPGDALYGIKRASEDTEYSLAGGAVDRGKLKLEFAGRRIGEVTDLLSRTSAMAGASGPIADGAGINPDTATLIRDTLSSADDDVRTAAQLLGGAAVRSVDRAPLAAITSWTPDRISTMRAVAARVPTGSVHRAAEQTLSLLGAAQQRATRLSAQLGCGCLDPANADALGPRPCSARCSSTAPTTGRHGTGPSTGPGPTRRHPSGVPNGPGGTAPAGRTTAPIPASGGAPATTPPPLPGHRPTSAPASTPPLPTAKVTTPAVPLPSLPGGIGSSRTGSSPPLPVTVSSSCVRVSAGPIQIGVGNC